MNVYLLDAGSMVMLLMVVIVAMGMIGIIVIAFQLSNKEEDGKKDKFAKKMSDKVDHEAAADKAAEKAAKNANVNRNENVVQRTEPQAQSKSLTALVVKDDASLDSVQQAINRAVYRREDAKEGNTSITTANVSNNPMENNLVSEVKLTEQTVRTESNRQPEVASVVPDMSHLDERADINMDHHFIAMAASAENEK